jgi:hypothetical protein
MPCYFLKHVISFIFAGKMTHFPSVQCLRCHAQSFVRNAFLFGCCKRVLGATHISMIHQSERCGHWTLASCQPTSNKRRNLVEMTHADSFLSSNVQRIRSPQVLACVSSAAKILAQLAGVRLRVWLTRVHSIVELSVGDPSSFPVSANPIIMPTGALYTG